MPSDIPYCRLNENRYHLQMLQNLTLADLEPGESGLIVRIDTRDASVRRLMVLGLVEDAAVQFTRAAIGGDPLEFELYGIAISLRRDQARKFSVARIKPRG